MDSHDIIKQKTQKPSGSLNLFRRLIALIVWQNTPKLKTRSEMKNIPHLLRIQKTDRYVRFAFGKLNIYLSLYPLRTRPQNKDTGGRKTKRKDMKRKLLDSLGHCEICGKPLTWTSASIHHIIPKSVDPSKEFDFTNLQLLCTECHIGIHRAEQLEAKQKRIQYLL